MRKFLTLCMVALMGLSFIFAPATPVFAAGNKNCVSTSILGKNGEMCDDGKGSSVMEILNLVVDIMSVGVGILGVIGITIVGIQYLTAGGSEEKVRKSKRRMLEIVIGIAVYAILYAGLKWLLPSFTDSGTSGTPTNPTPTYTSPQECENAGKVWTGNQCN